LKRILRNSNSNRLNFGEGDFATLVCYTRFVMKKNCASCDETFAVANEDLDFYEKISPEFHGRRYLIPPPTFCPSCRLRRRLTWRNEYQYYQRTCDLCDRKIVTVHSPDKPYPVYCNYCWWGDEWDRFACGREFDFTRGFFEQFVELQEEVPQPAMMSDNGARSENCDYCQDLGFSKNCYFVTGSWHLRDTCQRGGS